MTFSDSKNFWLSKDFKEALKKSSNPYQTKKVVIPFKTNWGSKHVTKGFQFCKAIAFSELLANHGIKTSIESNPDIFFIDCKGLNGLEASTLTLKSSMFSICQIASINVLLIQGMINAKNFEDVSSLF